MISFDALVRLIGDVQAEELRRWIDEAWVRPEGEAQAYVFHEVDVARVRLIRELRYELAIDDEAMPVVLRLLDQVYALRRRLRAAREAIEAQPDEVRRAMRARLRGWEDEI